MLKEENLRRFKKEENEDEDDDKENLIDEWNKVWNNIQVVFDKNEFYNIKSCFKSILYQI